MVVHAKATDGHEVAALGAYAGNEEKIFGRQGAQFAEFFGVGSAADEHEVVGGGPLLAALHDLGIEGQAVFLGGELKIGAALVGGQGQYDAPLARKGEEWAHGVFAHVGGEGDGVGAEGFKHSAGVGGGGIADVAALGVGDDKVFGADVGDGIGKGAPAGGAEGFVKS